MRSIQRKTIFQHFLKHQFYDFCSFLLQSVRNYLGWTKFTGEGETCHDFLYFLFAVCYFFFLFFSLSFVSYAMGKGRLKVLITFNSRDCQQPTLPETTTSTTHYSQQTPGLQLFFFIFLFNLTRPRIRNTLQKLHEIDLWDYIYIYIF